ncbi:MAG: class I SAM-dependent methyltransferase [Candidatus Magasanikbacteria bacterium]|nr:class I SAM-dependent methyltransferase [Candidatus Magasanikbacteria bacterium]
MRRQNFLYKYIKGDKFLNVGNAEYGGGYHNDLINRYPEVDFYGLDVAKLDNVQRQFIGSCEDMPFDDNTFDTVYMGEVIEHVWNPLAAVKEAYRVLKPGGLYIFDTPNPYSLSRILRYSLKRSDHLGNPDHKIFFSRATINKLLAIAGFTLVEFTTENNFSTHFFSFNFPTKLFWHFGECYLVAAKK